MHRLIVIDIDGTVDHAGLDRLRAHLCLVKKGRLTDDWDQEFGHRKFERTAGHYLMVDLFRNFDESWKVSVSDTDMRDPNEGELESLQTKLVDGIIAAGFEATVRAKPTLGTRPKE